MKEEFNFKGCPTQRDILPYLILELHRLGGVATKREVVDNLARLFDLSDEILEETTGSGAPKFDRTVAFARLKLRLTDYIGMAGRGLWNMTQKGREAVEGLEARERNKLDAFRQRVEEEAKSLRANGEDNETDSEEVDLVPEDDGENIHESILSEDLGKIKTLDPFAFERLCVQLLRESNYEGVEVTKRSSDGGIDGFGFLVIDLIRFKIVFQAKRYGDAKVGPDYIDALFGAQNRANAEKALFIATSDFTKEAKKRALEHGIELINGEKLMRLLFEKGIGYRKILDDDFLKNL